MNSTGIGQFFFRSARNSDGVTVQALVFAVLREYGLPPDPENMDADLFDIERAYSGGFFGLIIRKNQQIVGTFGLAQIDSYTAEIRKMYLIPEVRGIGLGKWMLEFLIEKSRKLGFRKLRLETHTILKEAIGLYESRGFQQMSAKYTSPRFDRIYELSLI